MNGNQQVAGVLEQARALRAAGAHDEARAQLVELASRHPDHAIVQYESACVHDGLGLEAQAVPYYERAIRFYADDLDRRWDAESA